MFFNDDEVINVSVNVIVKKVHVCTKRGAYMYFFWYKSVPEWIDI